MAYSFAIKMKTIPISTDGIDFQNWAIENIQTKFWTYNHKNSMLKWSGIDLPIFICQNDSIDEYRKNKIMTLYGLNPNSLKLVNPELFFTKKTLNLSSNYQHNLKYIYFIGFSPDTNGCEIVVNNRIKITNDSNKWTWWFLFLDKNSDIITTELNKGFCIIYKSIVISEIIEEFKDGCVFQGNQYNIGDSVYPNKRNWCNKCRCYLTGDILCSEEYCPSQKKWKNPFKKWEYNSPPKYPTFPNYSNPPFTYQDDSTLINRSQSNI